jgi:hypothetical protein
MVQAPLAQRQPLSAQPDGGLVDQLVFGVGEVGHQQTFRWVNVFWVVLFHDEFVFVTV